MIFRRIKALFCLIFFVILTLPTSSVHAQTGDARVGFFEEYEIKPGKRVEVPVEIRDVEDLYAIDVKIEFDPAVMMVEDADLSKDGIQPALGTFLEAGIVLFNTVDNQNGVIHLAMTQVNPSEPKSGDGIILVLYIKGLAEGESPLEITNLQLSTRRGEEIPSEPVDGLVTVTEEAEDKEATPIPVQSPTVVVTTPETTSVSPTFTPSPTSIPTSTATLTITEVFTDSEDPADRKSATPATPQETTPTNSGSNEEQDQKTQQTNLQGNGQSGFSLLKYWWIVALILVVALGMGIYLWVTRK